MHLEPKWLRSQLIHLESLEESPVKRQIMFNRAAQPETNSNFEPVREAIRLGAEFGFDVARVDSSTPA